MRSFLLAALLTCIIARLAAQQVHFVYLQTDSHKPFYLQMNKKIYSSSSIGYVILPKLQNGEYPVKVGFAGTDEAPKDFVLKVQDNDQGFLLKDFGDKGWGIFNLQTLAIQYAGEAGNQQRKQQEAEQLRLQQAEQARQQAEAVQRRNDSLQAEAVVKQKEKNALDSVVAAQKKAADETAAVQKAADDKATLQKAADDATAQQQKEATEKAALEKQAADNAALQKAAGEKASAERQTNEMLQRRLTDSLNKAQSIAFENERLEKVADSIARVKAAAIEKAKQQQQIATVPIETTPAPPKDSLPTGTGTSQNVSSPILLQKTFTDSGWRYLYAIRTNDRRENIDVFIPYHQVMAPVVAAPVTTIADTTPAVLNTETAITKQPVSMPVTPAAEKISPKDSTRFLNMEFGDKVTIIGDSLQPGVKILHNSNCRASAGEKDFLAARKKLAAADGTDNMIAIARKLMKEKCYTTEQIRNLSFLFLTDADRYQFLDAAYPFALDAYRFNLLQDLLKDDYYVQRFKAMLH